MAVGEEDEEKLPFLALPTSKCLKLQKTRMHSCVLLLQFFNVISLLKNSGVGVGGFTWKTLSLQLLLQLCFWLSVTFFPLKS